MQNGFKTVLCRFYFKSI